MSDYETVTIFRTWVEIAEALKTDAERGRLYHAICRYSLYGEPPKLEGLLGTYFTLMQPSIDKSNKRRTAQRKGAQKQPQPGSQNGLQNGLQNEPQNGLQNEPQPGLQNVTTRARKTETETEILEREFIRAHAVRIENLRRQHPRCLNVRDDLAAIVEAVRREADKPGGTVGKALTLLEEAVSAYAAAVGRWPPKLRKYVTPCGKWFREGRYLENPEMWEQETGGRTAKEGGTYVPRH